MDSGLKKNLSYQTIYQVLTVVTPLIVTPYVSRVLGSANIGIYSYTNSIAYYFVMFALLGVANYGSRTIAAVSASIEKRSKVFGEIYGFQLIMGIVMTAFYAIYLLFICDYEKQISTIQILYVLTGIFDISWLFFGVEDVKPVVIKNTIIKLVSLFGIFIFVKKPGDLWIYTLLLAGGQLGGCVSMWLSLKNKVNIEMPTFSGIRQHIIPNITLFVPVISISVYKTMDKIMIGALSTDAQVGFYTNAESLINAPMGFVTAIGTVMLPRITAMLANNETEKSVIYFRKSLSLTMAFVSAAAFGIIAVAPVFVPIYYGSGFEECIFLLEGQAVILLFIAWANIVRTQYLLPHKKDQQYILSIILGAVVNVILNAILIPKFQARGALIATIVAEGLVCIVQSHEASRYILMRKCIKENFPFLVMGGIMLIAVRFAINRFGYSLGGLLIEIAIGGIVYVPMLLLYYFAYLRKRV